ncbi:hypothetical protein RIR_jg30442.t1 [Rhizophagus irregularis DAOM 181602=DAOM 197198]|nr:hypothetical protein RIR_jg30442.t1 [Rhizophagus irregularis DAOM 181602=DAOM 197198]
MPDIAFVKSFVYYSKEKLPSVLSSSPAFFLAKDQISMGYSSRIVNSVFNITVQRRKIASSISSKRFPRNSLYI